MDNDGDLIKRMEEKYPISEVGELCKIIIEASNAIKSTISSIAKDLNVSQKDLAIILIRHHLESPECDYVSALVIENMMDEEFINSLLMHENDEYAEDIDDDHIFKKLVKREDNNNDKK